MPRNQFSLAKFWRVLVSRIESKRNWKTVYVRDKKWTSLITGIFKDIGGDLGFTSYKEYFRLDMGYFTESSDHKYDWRLDVAIEHENSDRTWMDEVCKLAHIAVPWKIIMLYNNFNRSEDRLTQQLEKAVEIIRTRGCQKGKWLFIVGPTTGSRTHPFRTFTYNSEEKNARLLRVKFEPELNPKP
ncbi:MAG: hypothetical protein L0Y74_06650 [candidate division Zixibacteria bacterium]|nr:hypothetical protein [candidate division Zixibacteria bacterium]